MVMAVSNVGAGLAPAREGVNPSPTSTKAGQAAMPNIRAAVVGAGYVAAFHIEAMAGVPGLEIAAVCDPDLERARALAQRWGIPAAVASIGELAALDVQVAHVLTPPDLHVRVTRELLEAG